MRNVAQLSLLLRLPLPTRTFALVSCVCWSISQQAFLEHRDLALALGGLWPVRAAAGLSHRGLQQEWAEGQGLGQGGRPDAWSEAV